ncbi:acetate--CoA ligase family protein [Streptosporangiaceae bacterium NEAU-GS5]|nr:acetate--CoA ligase family protein [Streptosporangiaceae bacterium NEAU-GS5]
MAVVGASDDPAKWGYWLARGALAGAARRSVYLVNARVSQVQDHPTYPSLAALPEPPELVALVTPPATYESLIDEALPFDPLPPNPPPPGLPPPGPLAAGTRYLVAITAGVDRAYPGGHAALAARVRAAGARLLGPTCMGVYDSAAELALTWGTLTPGPIGVVSQSGSVGLEIGYLAAREGLGLSRFVSLGAQADLTAAELTDAVVAAPHTKVVVLYLEDLSIGRELIAIADRARSLGKRIILLAVGGSAAAERAVRSHTGALATPDAVVDALCDAAALIRVHTPAQAVHAAQLALTTLHTPRPAPTPAHPAPASAGPAPAGTADGSHAPGQGPHAARWGIGATPAPAHPVPASAGPAPAATADGSPAAGREPYAARLGIVADSGGQGALAAELAERLGLDVPPLSDATRAELASLLPEDAGLANPIDLAGAGEADLMTYPETVARVAADVDVVLLTGYFGAYAADSPDSPALLAAETAAARRLLDVIAATGTPCLVHAMRTDGPAATLLRAAGTPVFSTVDAPLQALAAVTRYLDGIRPLPGPVPPSRSADPPASVSAVRGELIARGIAFPDGALAATPDDAAVVAEHLIVQGPVVLKAVGPAHKTEVGGVVLGLTSPGAVLAAAEDMAVRLGEQLQGFWVERQAAADGVEILVGARRDPNLGVIVTVGAGGVLAELIGDTATALGPLDAAAAVRLLGRTKAGAVLSGWRGGRPYDMEGVARAIAAIGAALDACPGLTEVEMNPLLVTADGTIALDLLEIA